MYVCMYVCMYLFYLFVYLLTPVYNLLEFISLFLNFVIHLFDNIT